MTVALAQRVLGWEYLVVSYRPSAAALAELLPEGLEPLSGAAVGFEWQRTLTQPTGGERIDAAVVVPCRHRGREIGYELRHYCDQLRPARLRAGIVCDGGPDFFAKLVAAPQLRMGTLHDGEALVAAAILAKDASGSDAGLLEAADWLALPRLKPAALGDADAARGSNGPENSRLTYQAKGAVTFQLRQAPSRVAVAPPVDAVLHAQFFVAMADDH